MTNNTYTNKSNTVRAARATLTKTLGLAKNEIAQGTHFEIEAVANGFTWVEVPQVEVTVNVVNRPKAGTLCAQVWDICDANRNLSRKEVTALAVEAGLNPATVRTQYQRWFTANK